jgi:hypothetical protein
MTVLTFTKSQQTVAQFKDIADQIDCNPVHQRLSRDSEEHTKSKGIIQTMLMGMDIGQITLHETPEGEFAYESIDGGHRKRAILAFLGNQFSVTIQNEDGEVKQAFFKDFTDDQREQFRNLELTFCIYENLAGPQVGNIFRTLNTITKINISFREFYAAMVPPSLVLTVVTVGFQLFPDLGYYQKKIFMMLKPFDILNSVQVTG